VGIILLVMLLVFIGPNILPSLAARTFDFIDEGVPCTRLRQAENRNMHQSYIGRNAVNPISVRVIPSALPAQGQGGDFIVRLVIENTTIGSIPIVFDERQVIVGDDPASSGFGIIFTPPNGMTTGGFRQTAGGNIPESSIRILGPRQRCVHRIVFPSGGIDPTLYSGNTLVQGYYRILTPGATAGGIFPDQGLAMVTGGLVVSDSATISTVETTVQAQ
jgi:hypothetical protein